MKLLFSLLVILLLGCNNNIIEDKTVNTPIDKEKALLLAEDCISKNIECRNFNKDNYQDAVVEYDDGQGTIMKDGNGKVIQPRRWIVRYHPKDQQKNPPFYVSMDEFGNNPRGYYQILN